MSHDESSLVAQIALRNTFEKIERTHISSVETEVNEIIKSTNLHLLIAGIGLNARGSPDRQTEADLVDQISNVVDEVQQVGRHGAGQETKIVAQGVDGPTNGNDETHGAVSVLGSFSLLARHGTHSPLGQTVLHGISFTSEDLVQDEQPTGHSDEETNP